MTNHYTWSTIPADNSDADADINWKELQPPDTVNNSARQMMTRGAEWRLDMSNVRVSTGAANTYEITVQSDLTATGLVAGMMFAFRAHQTNTGACTLNVNGLSRPLRSISGQDVGAAGIINGQVVLAFYNPSADEFLFPYANGVQQGGPGSFTEMFIGVDNTTSGTVSVFGGNIGESGGVVRIYNSASQDDVADYYELRGNAADGNFQLIRSSTSSADIAVEPTGKVLLSTSTGNIDVANNGVTGAYVRLLGAPGTGIGSALEMFKGTSVTGNGELWQFRTNGETLEVGSGSPFAVVLRLNADTGIVEIPQLGTGAVAATNGILSSDGEKPIGQDQTWEEISPPAANVANQNVGNRSIMVYGRQRRSSAADARLEVSVNGVDGWVECGLIGRRISTNGGDDNHSDSCTAIVPAGHSWRFTSTMDYAALLR